MQCLITKAYPPTPPIVNPGLDDQDRPFPTYGAHIEPANQGNADQDLVEIVDQCLAHNPSQRPTLGELLRFIPPHEAGAPRDDMETYQGPNPGLQGTDEQLREWIRAIMYDAPIAPDQA
jgi:serine/threonine protein kinase